jgi:hypothetical protein
MARDTSAGQRDEDNEAQSETPLLATNFYGRFGAVSLMVVEVA